MKKLVFIILLFGGPLILLTGQQDVEAMIHELEISVEDTTRLRLLSEVTNYFRTRDFDSAIHYLDQYAMLADQNNDLKSLAEAYYFLGGTLTNVGSINSAAEYYNQALNLYEELEDSSGIAMVLNGFGRMYLREDDNEEALAYFTRSQDIYVALGEEEYLPYLYQNMGVANDELMEYGTARKYYEDALELIISTGDTSRVLGSALLNMGEHYELSNELEKAFDYFQQSLEVCRKLGIRPRIADAYYQIGRYYYMSGNYSMAKIYVDSASVIANELNIFEEIRDQSLLYSEIFEKQGDYEAALHYAQRYNQLSDQFRQQELNKQLERLRLEREMSRIERKNAIAIQKMKLTRNFTFLAFILLFITLAFIYRNYRNKKRANAILAELAELKSNMFSNISHELRTPLTLILDPIEQMMEDEGKSPGQRTLKAMERNTLKILGLVNQMLDLSKLDAGHLKIDLSRERIIHHVKVIASSFVSMAEKKEIHYITKYPEDELETWVDFDKLDKILSNLLSNAFKYTPDGGSISLIVSLKEGGLKKSPLKADNWLYLSVHDTGKGIPEEDLPKIFNRFYQVGDLDDPARIGTGIGLALTKELTDLMKGEIVAESKLGHGTHINLSIPLGKAHLDESEYTLVEPRTTTVRAEVDSSSVEFVPEEDEEFIEDSPIILVVDDSEDIRVHIRDNIKGFNVLEAENGEVGLKTALESIPDLVITDLRMPEMDGIELCKRIKENELTSHIPVIMLTAKSGVESRLEGLETGADDYLTKPFNSKELSIRVQNLVTQREKLREKYRKEFLLEPAAVTVESADQKFLNRTREVIEEQIADPDLSVEELGKSMSMSRMQLFRKIKSLTDQSPSEYIRTIRLKRAAQLIKTGYGNLAEITYEVGFNHPSYFAKCFRDLYGVAPSEYAK